MYRSRIWTMRQYSGFGTATETNKRYKYLLSKGTDALSVAFDLPTQMGIDPDNLRAQGEVGRLGVSISTIQDMETLFDGIPLDKISVSMTINSTASILLAFLIVLCEKRQINIKNLRGTVQNDILKEYISRGTYIYPPEHGLKLVTDIIEFSTNNLPSYNFISVSGYHIREAGSTAVDEIAFTFANAICYIESCLKKGLKIDDFAGRIAFFFNSNINFLEEISKFRAARKLWAFIMKNRFNAQKKESLMLRFHTQTAGSSLTSIEPHNNIVRTTTEALAAILGGTQSLHTNGYDEAIGLPSEESVKLSLRTQQILAYETGVADSADPLGGSYLIEDWTDRIFNLAQKRISEIDELGGMISSIKSRFPQSEIEKASYKTQILQEKKEVIVAGVNFFQEENSLNIDDSIKVLDQKSFKKFEKDQINQIKLFKSNRNQKAVENSLRVIKEVAQNESNLMTPIIEAVKCHCSLGEISDTLKSVFGDYDYS